MNRIVTIISIATVCAISSAATGAVTKTVVDLPSAQGTMRFLHVRPDAPIATVVGLGGLDGTMSILNSGDATSETAACDLMYRNIDSFAARGIAVVVVDERYPNMLPIVDWLRARDAIPHWIAAKSRGSEAAVALAVQAQATAPVGALFFSPAFASGSAITGPALVIYHAEDTVSRNIGEAVYNSLTSASVRELVIFSGGGSPPCTTHGFSDLYPVFVDVVADFIEKHNPSISTPPPAPTAVEYFNAGFGHYFMTADADEVAGLDAGAFGGAFVRTGRSFKVHDAPAAGTVPVCRFFTTPGNFGAKSSHFYTADPAECDYVKLNPNWSYEKIAFHIAVPANGTCAAGTIPVWRAFNDGKTGAPNHRFTTDAALYLDLSGAQGWLPEGIVFCASQ